MFTRTTINLPTLSRAIPETVDAEDFRQEARLLRAQVNALRKEHYAFMRAVHTYLGDLNKKGALSISQASINSSPIGDVTPDTGVFTAIFASLAGVGVAPVATSYLSLGAGTTALSSLNVPHGAAPTSPVDGDIWTTTAGLYVRINGATVGPLN